MSQEAGKFIIIAGAIIVFIGILAYFFHNQLGWFGKLPGDIRYKSGNVRFLFPCCDYDYRKHCDHDHCEYYQAFILVKSF